jgi:hypothetical protein
MQLVQAPVAQRALRRTQLSELWMLLVDYHLALAGFPTARERDPPCHRAVGIFP